MFLFKNAQNRPLHPMHVFSPIQLPLDSAISSQINVNKHEQCDQRKKRPKVRLKNLPNTNLSKKMGSF
jgi:hypothetical protein